MREESGDRIDTREGGGTRREVYVRYYEGMSIYRDGWGYEATSFSKAMRERPLLKSASFEASLSREKLEIWSCASGQASCIYRGESEFCTGYKRTIWTSST
jgi:hypothetical protein